MQQPRGAAGAGVVTPEAVRLDFDAAGVGSRAVAFLLDWLARLAVLLLLSIAAGLAGSGGVSLPTWVVITLVSVLVFLLVWGYPIAFETLWKGRTPGKAAMGLRVVTVEGAPIQFRHAAIRAAVGLVDFGLTAGFAAVASALATARHQRLGDLAAGTIVLRERTGSATPTAVRFTVPPGAEGYAALIDPAGMTSRDYAAIRSFLLRADELDPQVRTRLAWQLAQPLAERLAHRPPADVSPELFLVCAAARYQQRSGDPRAGRGAPFVPAPPAVAGPPVQDPPTVRGGGDEGESPPGAGTGFVPPA